MHIALIYFPPVQMRSQIVAKHVSLPNSHHVKLVIMTLVAAGFAVKGLLLLMTRGHTFGPYKMRHLI